MGFSIGLRKHKGFRVRVAPPECQNFVCQLHQPLFVRAVQPNNAHGPFYETCFHILVSPEGDLLFHRCLLHGEAVASALEMLMAQNAAAYNGQVCIAANEIVREHGDEIQQLFKG